MRPENRADSATTQYNNNSYGGGYGQSNPYDNAPPPQYGMTDTACSPWSQALTSTTGQQPVEMQNIGQSDNPYAQQQNPTDPNAILNDCRAVGRAIDDLESRLGNLQRSQRQFISSSGDSSKEVDALSADIMSGYRGLADRVKRIKSRPESQDPRNKPQVDALDRRIRKAINSYQQVESQFRKDVQEQQRRQFLIVRPDATEEEIKEATSEGADTQVFQKALMNSDRHGQAQSALSNVRQRHAAIQQIEATMLELQQLFQDLDAIVVEQEPMVQNVEQRATETHEHLEQGNVQIDRAIVSARAARKKKWICLGICVAIILVIVIIILIWAGVTGKFVSRLHVNEVVRYITNTLYRAAAVTTTPAISCSQQTPSLTHLHLPYTLPSDHPPRANSAFLELLANPHPSHLSLCFDTRIPVKLCSAIPLDLCSTTLLLVFRITIRSSCRTTEDRPCNCLKEFWDKTAQPCSVLHRVFLLTVCYFIVYCTKKGKELAQALPIHPSAFDN
jgi:syntaxin 1B/2/3